MKKLSEKFETTLEYLVGREDPENGVFEGGVVDPKFTNEILIWVEAKQAFDPEVDDFASSPGHQINIGGSSRALCELGRYLIALSRLKTADKDYHDHLDGVAAPQGKEVCDLIIHSPTRFQQGTGSG
jgi:hypothetical protein